MHLVDDAQRAVSARPLARLADLRPVPDCEGGVGRQDHIGTAQGSAGIVDRKIVGCHRDRGAVGVHRPPAAHQQTGRAEIAEIGRIEHEVTRGRGEIGARSGNQDVLETGDVDQAAQAERRAIGFAPGPSIHLPLQGHRLRGGQQNLACIDGESWHSDARRLCAFRKKVVGGGVVILRARPHHGSGRHLERVQKGRPGGGQRDQVVESITRHHARSVGQRHGASGWRAGLRRHQKSAGQQGIAGREHGVDPGGQPIACAEIDPVAHLPGPARAAHIARIRSQIADIDHRIGAVGGEVGSIARYDGEAHQRGRRMIGYVRGRQDVVGASNARHKTVGIEISATADVDSGSCLACDLGARDIDRFARDAAHRDVTAGRSDPLRAVEVDAVGNGRRGAGDGVNRGHRRHAARKQVQPSSHRNARQPRVG